MIATVESLSEYQRSDDGPKQNREVGNSGRDGRDKREFKKNYFQAKSIDKRPEDKRNDYEDKKCFIPKGGCFVCKGPHAMNNCPMLGSLCTILEGGEVVETEAKHIGSVQLLNALKAKPISTSSNKGFMYVEASINGRVIKAMVDTGATHNFSTENEAKRLGLHGTGWMKTMNASARRLNGIAKDAELSLGTWKGRVHLSVALLDDFNVVLGMNFL